MVKLFAENEKHNRKGTGSINSSKFLMRLNLSMSLSNITSDKSKSDGGGGGSNTSNTSGNTSQEDEEEEREAENIGNDRNRNRNRNRNQHNLDVQTMYLYFYSKYIRSGYAPLEINIGFRLREKFSQAFENKAMTNSGNNKHYHNKSLQLVYLKTLSHDLNDLNDLSPTPNDQENKDENDINDNDDDDDNDDDIGIGGSGRGGMKHQVANSGSASASIGPIGAGSIGAGSLGGSPSNFLGTPQTSADSGPENIVLESRIDDKELFGIKLLEEASKQISVLLNDSFSRFRRTDVFDQMMQAGKHKSSDNLVLIKKISLSNRNSNDRKDVQ